MSDSYEPSLEAWKASMQIAKTYTKAKPKKRVAYCGESFEGYRQQGCGHKQRIGVDDIFTKPTGPEGMGLDSKHWRCKECGTHNAVPDSLVIRNAKYPTFTETVKVRLADIVSQLFALHQGDDKAIEALRYEFIDYLDD